ncbi:nuclear transport factor 2 family protein [Streptomyces sp. NBC_01500]|uniref:nuclear transport factor 2 family protein n=1 Tax=Streptomyces sp. NBC_01500 TaxID=2903886 RepID=UPI00224F8A91|nr:nuclear transport factor 2 family protein [Streptomyces sp. NBC_01500]MCX4550245.1 nuclear transport factor 2 family protein [Streptomyces sp. NBC_01500]
MTDTTSAAPGPREVLARYHRAMLDKSADDLADLYAADAVHEFPFLAPGMPARYQGQEEIRSGYRAAWGASPVRLGDIRDVMVFEAADPEVIVGQWAATGTVTTTGRTFSATGLLILQVRDGRIVQARDYMDSLGTYRELDQLPALVAALRT